MQPITLYPHSPLWKHVFTHTATHLHSVFTSNNPPIPVTFISHLGSTSIPGLLAKPVLDIDIIVPDEEAIQEAQKALVHAVYEDCGVPGRVAMRQPVDTLPDYSSGTSERGGERAGRGR